MGTIAGFLQPLDIQPYRSFILDMWFSAVLLTAILLEAIEVLPVVSIYIA